MNEDSVYNMASYRLGYFDTKREAELLALEYARQGKIEVGMYV